MQQEEAAAIAELKAHKQREKAEKNTSRGRKRGGPSPSTSDEEQETPNKKSSTPENITTGETTTNPDDPPIQEKATPPTPSPTPPKPAGFPHFMPAMQTTAWQCNVLMKAIPGDVYYCCRGYFLYHKYGNYMTAAAKAGNVKNQKEKNHRRSAPRNN